MKDCKHCDRTITTIEAANCKEIWCPNRDLAIRGNRGPLAPTFIDPLAPAEEINIRTMIALEIVKYILASGNSTDGERIVCVSIDLTDYLIQRLNETQNQRLEDAHNEMP